MRSQQEQHHAYCQTSVSQHDIESFVQTGCSAGCCREMVDSRKYGKATDLQEIRDEVALKIRLAPFTDLVSLQQIRDAVGTNAGNSPPAQAARVHDVVPDQVSILVQSVMGLAEGDARAAAGNEAGIDGIEAAEEGRVPRSGTGGVRDAGVVFGGVVDAVHPMVGIALHLRLLVGGGGHCWELSGWRNAYVGKWGKREKVRLSL